jgi:hypothetical protein
MYFPWSFTWTLFSNSFSNMSCMLSLIVILELRRLNWILHYMVLLGSRLGLNLCLMFVFYMHWINVTQPNFHVSRLLCMNVIYQYIIELYISFSWLEITFIIVVEMRNFCSYYNWTSNVDRESKMQMALCVGMLIRQIITSRGFEHVTMSI